MDDVDLSGHDRFVRDGEEGEEEEEEEEEEEVGEDEQVIRAHSHGMHEPEDQLESHNGLHHHHHHLHEDQLLPHSTRSEPQSLDVEEQEEDRDDVDDELDEGGEGKRKKSVSERERKQVERLQLEATNDSPEVLWEKGFIRMRQVSIAHVPEPSEYYERDIMIWWPAKQLIWASEGYIHCHCGQGGSKFEKGWWSPNTREVIDINRTYLMTYRQYRCDTCKRVFSNNDENVLEKNPEEFREHFDLVNFKRCTLTKQLCRAIRFMWESATPLTTLDFFTSMHLAHYEKKKRMFFAHWRRAMKKQIVDEQVDVAKFGTAVTEQQKRVYQARETPLQKHVIKGIGDEKAKRLRSADILTIGQLASLQVDEMPLDSIVKLTGSKEKNKVFRVRNQIKTWQEHAQNYCVHKSGTKSFEEFREIEEDLDNVIRLSRGADKNGQDHPFHLHGVNSLHSQSPSHSTLPAVSALAPPPPPPPESQTIRPLSSSSSSSPASHHHSSILTSVVHSLSSVPPPPPPDHDSAFPEPPDFGTFDSMKGYNGFRFHRKLVENAAKYAGQHLLEPFEGTLAQKRTRKPSNNKQKRQKLLQKA